MSYYQGLSTSEESLELIVQGTYLSNISRMNLSDLNKTVNDAAGKAQKKEGLSIESFLISLVVYGSIFLPAVYLFTFLKDSNYSLVRAFSFYCNTR